MRRVYMDSNATTPLLPEVFEAMRPYFTERFGNASSVHYHGQNARGAVEAARAQVAALVGANAREIVFTSGGTEADNLAIFGVLKPGGHMITSTIEHHAVLHAADVAEKRGVEVTRVGVDSRCRISPDDVKKAIRKNTKLISIMTANNETGVIQPVEEFIRIAHDGGALFHSDAVQAASKHPLDVKSSGADMLSISGHKIHGPQGTGALFVRKGIELEAQMHGGAHERRLRAGTENVPGIVGLGLAAEMAKNALSNGVLQNIGELRDQLERGLKERVDDLIVNGEGAPRVPNTLNARFEGVDSESLLIALDLKGLAVSAGSACSSGAAEPSHVLTAMGLTHTQARSCLRFSLCRMSTVEDVQFALQVVPEAVARLRSLSPASNS